MQIPVSLFSKDDGMRFLLVLILFSFGVSGAAQAKMFSINKTKFRQCVSKVEPVKQLFSDIGKVCARERVDRECRYGGKNSNSIYPDCPVELAHQMQRWIKQETAEIRKLGGTRAKESKKLMNVIGDAGHICANASDSGRSLDSLNRAYCQAIVLTQTYGMLYFIKTRMK